MQQANSITYEEGNSINAKAFEAGQLDSNKNVLFDGIGGKNDPTKAVASLETALASAKQTMDAFKAGKVPLERPVSVINTGTSYVGHISSSASSSLTKSSSGSTTTAASSTTTPSSGSISPKGLYIDGAGGFLFKPIADGDGKLAVLSPDGVAPLVDSISLLDSKGNTLEDGRFTSNGDDGKRAKYSFKKPGASYPKDLTVQIKYIDGTVTDYKIPDPSKRYD